MMTENGDLGISNCKFYIVCHFQFLALLVTIATEPKSIDLMLQGIFLITLAQYIILKVKDEKLSIFFIDLCIKSDNNIHLQVSRRVDLLCHYLCLWISIYTWMDDEIILFLSLVHLAHLILLQLSMSGISCHWTETEDEYHFLGLNMYVGAYLKVIHFTKCLINFVN